MLMADIVLNENFDQNKFSVGQVGSVTYDGSSDIAFEQWTPIFRGSAPYNGVLTVTVILSVECLSMTTYLTVVCLTQLDKMEL